MNKQKKLLLIDGNSVAFRAFFALHQSLERFVNHNGLHTTAIYGFKTMLDKIIEKVQPSHVLVAFDAGKKTFRTEKFTEYKGGRSKTPSELSEQFPYIKKLLTAYGIKSYELANFEADDIIGTLANEAEAQDFMVTIVTGDRDLTQLTTDKTTVAVTQKGVSEVEEYTPAHVFEKYGIKSAQIIDMKGLVGDNSDNYPGVTKVGEKTAVKLLQQFETIEGIYENLDNIKASKMKEHLVEDRELAFLCKDLAKILRNAPIEVTVDEAKWSGPIEDELRLFYEEMDFKSFLAKMSLPSNTSNSQTKQNKIPELEYQELSTQNIKQLVFEKKSCCVVLFRDEW